ncbi:unnamed protein product [Echinostoma caproni]|uniref:Attractin n=1 Tax=Echinostoma caproni TaxID=27848 RepID=A0A183A2G2_9TREM|nr:unnamed protein product [Echinostoma caproni]
MHQSAGSSLMEEIILQPEDVEKTLVSLDWGKAAEPNEIHPTLLGPLGRILAAPLARLFNLSMANLLTTSAKRCAQQKGTQQEVRQASGAQTPESHLFLAPGNYYMEQTAAGGSGVKSHCRIQA